MSTFDDKLFEVVKEVADVREMVGEKPLTETFAAKEHTHRVSDIKIYGEDVITEYGNNVTNGLIFDGKLFTYQQESDGYSFKLKNVPQGEWYMRINFTIEGNNLTNFKDSVNAEIRSTESYSKENEDIGYTIKGGKGCAEGIKVTVKYGTYLDIYIREATGIELPSNATLPRDEIAFVGTPINSRFIYGSAVKGFIGREVIPLITALEEKITALDTRIKALESPGG